MKVVGTIVALIAACALGGVSVFAIVALQAKPIRRPVCLVSHPEVVVIPTMCHKDDLCDKPIVAQVCDHIEMDSD